MSGKVNALIVGDSFAPDALNAFSQIYAKTNFILSSQGGCGPHQNIEQLNTPNVGKDKIEECRLLNKQRYDISYLMKFDYIIINVFFRYYSSENLIEYLNFLKSNGINNVIIFGGFYSLKFSDPDILAKYKSEYLISNNLLINNSLGDKKIQKVANDFDYLFLSKIDAFCRKKCIFINENNIPFTYDMHHLSYEFGRSLGNFHLNTINYYLDRKLILQPS